MCVCLDVHQETLTAVKYICVWGGWGDGGGQRVVRQTWLSYLDTESVAVLRVVCFFTAQDKLLLSTGVCVCVCLDVHQETLTAVKFICVCGGGGVRES